jgi:hypothetical protein
MFKILPLSIMLLAMSTPFYAQTYTVIHNFGSQAGDPSATEVGTIAQSRGGALFTTGPNPDGSSAALLNPALDKHSAQTGQLLARWSRLHAVRSILSTLALLLFLWLAVFTKSA